MRVNPKSPTVGSAKKRKTSQLHTKDSDAGARRIPTTRSVVPWSSFDEWLEIRQKVLDGSEESTKLALSRLQIWQLRCDSKKCPAFVEATTHLLRAFVADKDNADTSEVLSVYGEAINKFVQTMLERSNKAGEAAQNKIIAESLQIPPWIVDVRNDAIHHFRGSLPLYRTTANTVFTWLKQNYWAEDKQKSASDERPPVVGGDTSLQEYIQLALSAKSQTERSHAEAALSILRSSVLTSNPQTFIGQLHDLEVLTSVEGARANGTIPPNYKNALLPIFALLGKNLTSLLTGAIKSFSLPAVVCTNRDVNQSMQTIVQWIAWLFSGSAVWQGTDLASYLDAKKILQAAMTVISKPTIDLLEICLDKMEPPLSEEKADFVRKLYVAFSGERAKFCDGTNGFENITVATVDDIVAERANREKPNRQQVQSTPRVDWSVVPLGLLPDTVAVGNLYLEVDLEEDYVPLNVETEHEAVIKFEKKFREGQSQSQDIKSCDENHYESRRRANLSKGFTLWRITDNLNMDDDDEVYNVHSQSHM